MQIVGVLDLSLKFGSGWWWLPLILLSTLSIFVFLLFKTFDLDFGFDNWLLWRWGKDHVSHCIVGKGWKYLCNAFIIWSVFTELLIVSSKATLGIALSLHSFVCLPCLFQSVIKQVFLKRFCFMTSKGSSHPKKKKKIVNFHSFGPPPPPKKCET